MLGFDDIDIKESAAATHDERTKDLNDAERMAYNQGYLWASADSTKVFGDILKEDDLSDSEKLEVLQLILMQATIPLVIAGLAQGIDYLAD